MKTLGATKFAQMRPTKEVVEIKTSVPPVPGLIDEDYYIVGLKDGTRRTVHARDLDPIQPLEALAEQAE